MADRIKGITIEIGGDTTKLTDALKKTNGALRETQSSLKDVNKLLKFDPGNTALLTQKQDYLKKAVDETSKKLEMEKEALEQLKNSGDTEKTTEQQRALERQIADTTNKLEALKQESSDFGNVASQQFGVAAQKIKEVGQGITDVGKSMSAHVTAPLVAVGAASMAAFSEVDAAMDTVVVKTGASGEALESMQKIVGDLATTIPTTFEDAGTAVGEVNTRFGKTGEELESLSADFLKFAQINGTDVNSTIDATSQALSAWGLSADDASAYLDTMNKVGQNTGISMDTLNSAMASNAETFQQMGMSAADAANFLGQIELSGMDSSAAMKGMQTAMKNAAKEGKTLPDALKEMQEVMDSSASDTDKLNAAIELFGSKAGPQFFNAMQEGTVSLDEFGASLQDNLGSVSETFDATLDPVDDVTLAMNDLKLAGAELGSAIQSVLAPVLEQVAEKIKEVRVWFQNLDPAMQETIVKVGLIVAAIGPALMIIGPIITALSGVVGAIGAVVGVLGGPLTLAIAAAIAIGVALYKNWDTIKEAALNLGKSIAEAWEGIKKAVSDAVDGVKQTISDGLTTAEQTVTNVLDNIKKAFTDKFEAAKKIVTDAIDVIKKAFDFEWKLPDLKLPHFKISGEFSLNPPKAPSFGIDWYSKAMNNGMILNGATIFGAANGKLLGGGEAGPEAIVGVNSLMSMIRSAVGDTINYGGVNVVVYGAPGQDVAELADLISDRINAQVASRRAVFS